MNKQDEMEKSMWSAGQWVEYILSSYTENDRYERLNQLQYPLKDYILGQLLDKARRKIC